MKWSQVPWGEGWAAGGPWGWKLFLWKEKDILRGGTVTTQRNTETQKHREHPWETQRNTETQRTSLGMGALFMEGGARYLKRGNCNNTEEL